ncbi:hypothetical protein [Microbulbifer sediminum]|uniref:hypothetical protein n=1 Tax=Microbulbifer sediminum TaxID=2904250 RepID=UPI001F42C125|nr:hypothetical protein [Microbulbifer sediminum]
MTNYGLFGHFRLRDAQLTADGAARKSSDNRLDIQALQDQVDHLSVVCEAMSELMQEMGFSRAMLEKKIQEIDLRDGRLDGRHQPKKTCPSCARISASRHVRCLYCGAGL